MSEAIERIEKLIEVVREKRSETTGMTFILHELKRILEILKFEKLMNENNNDSF